MGLMDALGIGMKGLNAAQTSIDVAGQNISNANTEGYSRKKVDLQAASVNNEVYGQKGYGVDVTAIVRVRDAFLDRQIWEQSGDSGMTTELDNAYIHLENILKEPTDNGLAATLNKFWASWQDLANAPANLSARESVRSAGTILASSFHDVYKQIEDYGLSMNNPLAQNAKTVNDLTGQIYLLNEKISGVEARPGEKANDSRDQRDMLVAKLGKLIDVQTVEDEHGRILITSGGNLIVGTSESLKISTYGVDETLSDGSKSTSLRLKFEESGKAFTPRSGALAGIMTARSDVLASYKEKLNTLVKSIVTQVNNVHTLGYNLNKQTGVAFFDGAHTKASDISISDAVAGDVSNIAAAAGGKITDVASFQVAGGVPSSLTPTLDLKAINSSYQDLAQGKVQVTLTGAGPTFTPSTVLQEGAGKDYIIDYAKGTITFINYARYAAAANVKVQFSYNTTGFPGNGNGENAASLAKVRLVKAMSADSNGGFTQSVSEFYAAVVGKMGIDKNENKSRKETKEFLITQMVSEQASISGVSLDEEMTNMIKYQNSYKASAKYIQTISQMMEVLMSIQ